MKFAFGVYVYVPFGLNTSVPLVGWVTTDHTLPPSPLGVSLVLTLPLTGVSSVVLFTSFTATGTVPLKPKSKVLLVLVFNAPVPSGSVPDTRVIALLLTSVPTVVTPLLSLSILLSGVALPIIPCAYPVIVTTPTT